jgi:N-acetylglucosaminyldiphosphoundecaprenol N-acetyl-beta-D-mannosaminyltransferase
MKLERVQILGSPVSAINMEQACSVVMSALADKQKGYVCCGGVQLLTEAYEHEDYRELLERALLVTPDGMPLVWLGRLQGKRHMTRVYGPDLMLNICAASVETGHTHFLYGGNPGVADALKATLEKKFPGIRIVGTHCPPFRPLNAAEDAALVERISTAKPDIIWVGLGSPKQDRFMRDYLPKLDTTLMLGVGAAFDFHTGRVRQAPGWVQRSGMEWFFRVCCEPRRLAGRYFRNNPLFVWRLIREWLRSGGAVAASGLNGKR